MSTEEVTPVPRDIIETMEVSHATYFAPSVRLFMMAKGSFARGSASNDEGGDQSK